MLDRAHLLGAQASQLRSSMIGQGEPPKGRSQPVRKLRTGGLLPRNIQIPVQNTVPICYVRCDTQDEINQDSPICHQTRPERLPEWIVMVHNLKQETGRKLILLFANSPSMASGIMRAASTSLPSASTRMSLLLKAEELAFPM
jgi:hypothetical protein